VTAMQRINAVSLTHHVKDWLADSNHPRILHIFDNVCNLINERREILSIVTPEIGNGPFNLILEKDFLFSGYLSPESQILIFPTQLKLGNLSIQILNANLWSPIPDWESLQAKRAEILSRIASLPVNTLQPSLPTHLLSTFSAAILVPDLATCLAAAKQLAGLGQGLTPAGDDFIFGAILAAWIIHAPEVAKSLVEEITNAAAPLTTSLSAAWLRSAGRGEAGIRWHEFFESLVSDDPLSIQGAMDKILAVGETSGADALAGFIRLFAAQANR
jgi:Protein of unknown function (DUF2877)